jgi:glycerophosphoryl diester phosphodiesterase
VNKPYKSLPKLGGHRGCGCTDHPFYHHRDAPVENTFESLLEAWKKGADYVEVDAQVSQDGIPFLLHSVIPKEHIFKNPPKKYLNHLSWHTISKLKTGPKAKGKITTLKDALENMPCVKETPWTINIELKGVQKSNQPNENHRFFEQIGTIAEKFQTRILWSSFCLASLFKMQNLLPHSHYGVLFGVSNQPEPLYLTKKKHPHYQALPFTENSLNLIKERFNPKKTWLHPEAKTLHQVTKENMEDWKGINTWCLFAKSPDNAPPNVYSHITDYL